MKINHNIPALQASMNMRRNSRVLAKSMQRLSSGLKINSARDDSAGLAIANKLDVQVKGLTRASQNAMDGISLIQVAEGAMTEVHNMLQRMRELAVQASNDTNMTEDRSKIQMEINSLCDEISAISSRTEFNKIKVLNGEANRIASSSDRGVAIPLYVSETLSAGTLTYTISSPGEPAMYNFAPQFSNPNFSVTKDATLSINGVRVDVLANDSAADINQKLLTAFESAGIDVVEYGGSMYLASRVAGSTQKIDIKGEPSNIMSELGFDTAALLVYGKDAEVDKNSIIMQNPDGTQNTAFKETCSITADGNVVTITSNNGQEIKLNIKVHMNEKGELVYDKRDDNGDFVPIGVMAGMTLDITDYGPIKLHIGPNFNMQMDIVIPTMTSETLGLVEYKGGILSRMLNYQTDTGARNAIDKLDWAISKVSETRARLGAYQNRLEMTVRSLDATAESTETARSRIQDTNIAEETTRYTQYQVMEQAGISILGQANQRPQQILSLLN